MTSTSSMTSVPAFVNGLGPTPPQEPEEQQQTKRRRIAYACDLCRAKKNRCDGEQPTCGPCNERRAQCVYSPHKARASVTTDYVDNLKAKNEYLERQLREQGEVKVGPSSPHSIQNGYAAPPRSVPPTLPNAASSNSEYSLHPGQNASRTSANGEADAAQAAAQSLQDMGRRASIVDNHSSEYFGESSTFDFMTKVCSPATPGIDGGKGPPGLTRSAPKVATTPISVATASPSAPIFAGLLPGPGADDPLSLPARFLADRMVDAYFAYRHPLNIYLHEGTFRRRYQRLWLGEDMGGEEAPDLPWLGLVNLIFAFGSDHVQAAGRNSAERTRFFNRAKALVFSGLLQAGSIDLVQALLLMGQYLHGSLELNSCWTVVGLANRMAQGLGLHLDAAGFTNDVIEQEIRKRVWWGCFVIDRVLAMKVGRPPTIHDGPGIKAGMPLPVDDEYLVSDNKNPIQPAGVPSKLEFLNQLIKQCRLFERILETFYSGGAGDSLRQRSSDLPKLLAFSTHMDGDLSAWEQQLPAHLRFDSEVEGWQFQRQRSVLRMRFLNSRLLIHRQILLIYITRRITDFFQREIMLCCVRRCIMAAYDTITAMQVLYSRSQVNSSWHNSHYVFAALGVMLVFQTLDAQSKANVNLPPGVDVDDVVLRGTEFLDQVGSNMHTMAGKYVQSLRQLQTRLIALSEAKAKDARPQMPVMQQGQRQTQAEYPNNFYAGAPTENSMTDFSGPVQPYVNGDSTMMFDYNLAGIENLLYSPGWTGLWDPGMMNNGWNETG